MTTVLSDSECRIVAHLVENELQNGTAGDDDYADELEQLLSKVSPHR